VKRLFDQQAVGLYIHVPFCASICGYCDFFRLKTVRGVPEGYEDLLLREASLYAGDAPPVDTVFFGGGTPSLLSPPRFARLMEGLRGLFHVRQDAEVTLEANPETVSREALEAWCASGVDRLSIGAQSFDRAVLRSLERRAGPETAKAAVELAAGAGFLHLSVDLMTGVPGQGRCSLEADLMTLAAMPLDHVSVYSLDLHPKTLLHAAVLKGEKSLPSDEEAADLSEFVHERLCAAGFDHYEVSNFARPGGRCRHNLRYWQGGETIGLGPSAWSRYRGRLTGNPRNLEGWRRAVSNGEAPFETVEILSERRRMQDMLIFGLRVSDGVVYDDVAAMLAEDGRDPLELVETLSSHGYARLEDGRLCLTTLGFLVSNEVINYLLPEGWEKG